MSKRWFTKQTDFQERTEIKCAICGETDRAKMVVEQIGLATGMSGNDYSFCSTCWYSPDLGRNLLCLLGYDLGMKLDDHCVEVVED